MIQHRVVTVIYGQFLSLYARTLRKARGQVIGYEGLVLDITAQKRTEAALKASEAKYRTIFAASPDVIYLTDSDGKLLEANPALLEWQGLALAELQQRHFLDFFAGTNHAEVVQAFTALQQGHTVRGLEVWARNAQGETREFEVNATPLSEHGRGTVILSVARDLTERRRAEAALATLSRQLLEAQETERHRLAYELHDDLGQALIALKLRLQLIVGVPEIVAQRLQHSIKLVDDLLGQVRALSLNLRPVMLDQLGLEAALDWYVQRQAQQAGLVAHLAADPLEPRPHPLIETACFRVMQEAVTNVARHAQAHQVWVEVQKHDETLSLCVRDDGIGFDVPAALARARQGASLGLLSMKERLRLVEGRLEIRSTPGGGTEVCARVPLHSSVSQTHQETARESLPSLPAQKK
ncbi:MAG: PAS domain S-box protein [Deltaproteobacteria bacterium]|nr:PAS domain S-box protein [Deltaproteobacteria bacterium]